MAFVPGDNLLKSVDGKAVKCPSKFYPHISDISANNAGRTEDTVMHKCKIGQVMTIDVMWDLLNTKQLSEILQLFDKEYVTITYLNVKKGDFITDEFYVSDRTCQAYNSELDLWENLEFSLIKRDGR